MSKVPEGRGDVREKYARRASALAPWVWLSVPESAILRQPNPIGTAVAWFWESDGDIQVRCFIPEPER
jgi:hypothetical protein